MFDLFATLKASPFPCVMFGLGILLNWGCLWALFDSFKKPKHRKMERQLAILSVMLVAILILSWLAYRHGVLQIESEFAFVDPSERVVLSAMALSESFQYLMLGFLLVVFPLSGLLVVLVRLKLAVGLPASENEKPYASLSKRSLLSLTCWLVGLGLIGCSVLSLFDYLAFLHFFLSGFRS